MKKLSAAEIQKRLGALQGWSTDGPAIKKEWQFRDFVQALAFINKIAQLAERHGHHPELYNVYNRVSLRFSTHDAGGLTAKDFAIAEEIDRLRVD